MSAVTLDSGTVLNTTISNSSITFNINLTFDQVDIYSNAIYLQNISILEKTCYLRNYNHSVLNTEITFDNVAPIVGDLTSVSSTTSSITFSSEVSDSLTGILLADCSVNREGASITGTDIRTIVESGLDCGHDYSYTLTCSDCAGNTNFATASFSTSDCGTSNPGGGGSSGGGGTTWSKDYKVTAEQFTEGYSQELGTANRMKVKIGGEDHHVGVAKLTEITATIEIASEGSVQVELDVGEDAKMDITEDGYYDVYVRLDGISNSKADVFIQSIHELVPEGAEGVVSTTGEIVPEDEEEIIVDEKSYASEIIIGVVVLILFLIIVVSFLLKRKKKRKKRK